MALFQTPREGGNRQVRTHFPYVTTKGGAKEAWHAYIAGPCQWYTCHTKGKSKPCLHEVTNGELVCPRCHELDPPQTIGYQPLYRGRDSRPCVVIVYEYTREVVDAYKLHSRVLVGRETGATDGVYIIPAVSAEPRYKTSLKERMKDADPTESLIRMWCIPELTEWYNRTARAKVPMRITPPMRTPAAAAAKVVPADVPLIAVSDMSETMLDVHERIRAKTQQWEREQKERPDKP